MKILTHPVTGKQFKMGRIQPNVPHGRCSLRKLMNANVLPNVVVPARTNYSPKAATSLHNIFLNDTLGDCVIAGAFHVRGVTSYDNGIDVNFTNAQVVQDYSAIGGYDPNAPLVNGQNLTDQG